MYMCILTCTVLRSQYKCIHRFNNSTDAHNSYMLQFLYYLWRQLYIYMSYPNCDKRMFVNTSSIFRALVRLIIY